MTLFTRTVLALHVNGAPSRRIVNWPPRSPATVPDCVKVNPRLSVTVRVMVLGLTRVLEHLA